MSRGNFNLHRCPTEGSDRVPLLSLGRGEGIIRTQAHKGESKVKVKKSDVNAAKFQGPEGKVLLVAVRRKRKRRRRVSGGGRSEP